MKRELRIGIFLTVALIILAVFIFVVGNLSNLFRRPGYPVYVRYETSLGLDKTAAVKMAGIKIGYVKAIELENTRSLVTLSINYQYKIPVGSKAAQAVQGLLGEKYVEIQPTPSAEFVKPGGELEPGPSSGMDQLTPMLTSLGSDFQQVAKSLQSMMNERNRENFSEAMKNIASLSSELRDLIAENRGRIGRTVEAASHTAQDLDERFRAVAKSLDDTLADLRQAVQENRPDLREDVTRLKDVLGRIDEAVGLLNKTLEKIDKGEGTVGKLVNDEGLYNQAQNAVRDVRRISEAVAGLSPHADVRGEYLAKSEFLKMALSASVWYKQKVFVLAQVVHQPDAGRPEGSRYTVSAEGGYRWANLAPRAGIIESQFGAGLDYYAWNDRIILSVEGLNFNRAVSPLFRTYARVYPQRNVYLILGLEDFTLAANRQVFFGLGLGF